MAPALRAGSRNHFTYGIVPALTIKGGDDTRCSAVSQPKMQTRRDRATAAQPGFRPDGPPRQGLGMTGAGDRDARPASRACNVLGVPPQLSVVLAVFNGGRMLHTAVDSVLADCCADAELIVIDDGSTDGSAAALDHTRAGLRVVHQSNGGLASALRTGIALSDAPLIARMDHDDVNLPGRLNKLRAVLDTSPGTGLVSCWAEVIDQEDRLVGHLRWPWYPDDVLRDLRYVVNNVIHGAAVFRRDVYDRAGGYRDGSAEDYDLWLRMSEHGDVAIVPEVLYQYRRSSNGITATNGHAYDSRFRHLSDRNWKEFGPPPAPGPALARARNESYVASGGDVAGEVYVRSLLALHKAYRAHGHPVLAARIAAAAVAAAPRPVAAAATRSGVRRARLAARRGG